MGLDQVRIAAMIRKVSLLLLVAFGIASAQTSVDATAAFAGVVKDPHDSVIPGARITVIGERITIKERTDPAGNFRIGHLGPGAYSIQIEVDGAVPFLQKNIRLANDEVKTLAVTLQAGKDPICVLTVGGKDRKRK